jgi:NAD-dependent SIR2 family protein deacetylase
MASGGDGEAIERAAETLKYAHALLVTAGAGMGVDSGLPDFRGRTGFWRAYPAFEHLGLRFEEVANPLLFRTDPELAWGFYGHRLRLYRSTPPHEGFSILRRWGERMSEGYFAYTSNVDGHFQRAGFPEERVVECHGSIEHLQCLRKCQRTLYPAGEAPEVDEKTMRARPPLPACPNCGVLARPNILMFDDWEWIESRYALQQNRFNEWIRRVAACGAKLVILEIGAGTAIPTIRRLSEALANSLGATHIRINPENGTSGDSEQLIHLKERALPALQRLAQLLGW